MAADAVVAGKRSTPTGVLELTNYIMTGINALFFFFHVHIILDCYLFWSMELDLLDLEPVQDLEPAAICSTWSWSWRGPRRVEVICSRALVRKPPRTGGGLALARSPPAQGKGDLQQGAGQVPSGPGRRGGSAGGDGRGSAGGDVGDQPLLLVSRCW